MLIKLQVEIQINLNTSELLSICEVEQDINTV